MKTFEWARLWKRPRKIALGAFLSWLKSASNLFSNASGSAWVFELSSTTRNRPSLASWIKLFTNDRFIEVEGKNIQGQCVIGQSFIEEFHDARPRLPAKPDVLVFERVILHHILPVLLSLRRAGLGFNVKNQIRFVRTHLVIVSEMIRVGL